MSVDFPDLPFLPVRWNRPPVENTIFAVRRIGAPSRRAVDQVLAALLGLTFGPAAVPSGPEVAMAKDRSRLWLLALSFLAACGGASAEGPGTITPNADGSITVPIRLLERQMKAGVREPKLTEDVKQDFVNVAVTDPKVVVELCLDPDGTPDKVEVRESSKHEMADQIVTDAVRAWRFSPTVGVDGRPARVCTVVTFRWRVSFPPKREPSNIPL